FVHPPLGLWPSVGELRADYRTTTGEQRRLTLAQDVTVELNTRTSIAVRSGQGSVQGIDLIAGEAAIDTMDAPRPFAVVAGPGRALTQNARFEVRVTPAGACVTCIEGQVQVTHAAGTAILNGRQQLSYDSQSLGPVVSVDAMGMPAWRQGYLRFSEAPLWQVVEEINRYRPGRVVLLDKQVAARHVTGRFQIRSLDKAILQMQRSLGLEVRSLPGGIVLLS
ncbi:FecR domain-containing protein, partial [Cupriavidus basilensis]